MSTFIHLFFNYSLTFFYNFFFYTFLLIFFQFFLSGGLTSFITTPLDLIKTKLMIQSTSAGGQYAGVSDAFSR